MGWRRKRGNAKRVAPGGDTPGSRGLTSPGTLVHPLGIPRECTSLIPDARLTVIKGAGHMSQQDQAERFNQALREALR
jgi:pimeloyl-ACP methyl ester carboxylesterase